MSAAHAHSPGPESRARRHGAARGLFCLAAALLLSACAMVPVPRVERSVERDRAEAAWESVLQRFVNERGQVDFTGLSQDTRDLDLYIDYVARIDPQLDAKTFPTPEARLAHYINAYNALSMYGVLKAGIPRTNAGLRKVRFFFLKRYRIGGLNESLYSFEARIRELGEERIHFALNCMSVSCPRLPRTPFRPDTLKGDLERLARDFFDDPSYLQVDDARKVVRVSAILKFFTGDFLRHADSVVAYINLHRSRPVPTDYSVEFLPYDWTINRTPVSGAPAAG